MIFVHKEVYLGRNSKEYMVVSRYNADTDLWSIYLNDKNSIKKAIATTSNQPSVTILNNVVYAAGDGNTIKFAYYDSDDVYHSGTMSNAPQGEYIISAKNRLFLGGKTTSNYTTGTATFTQASAEITGFTYSTGTVTFTKESSTVTGSGTTWSTNTSVGGLIGVGDTPTAWYKIIAINSDTEIIIERAFEETTVTGANYVASKTAWIKNIRAGDMIGAGASPTAWYQVKKITNNYTLTITANFAETTAAASAYKIKRVAYNVVYHAAQGAFDDWAEPGEYGGDDPGFITMYKPNTGLHNFEDAVLLFTEDEGFFIEGDTISSWSVPKRTRFPVGCISQTSIASKNGYLTFTSQKGIYITKGGDYRLDSLEAEPYSETIERTFDFVDLDRSKYIFAFPYKDFLFIATPSTDEYSSTAADLIYDTGTVEVAATSSYSTGTVTATKDSTAITGSGTTWVGNVSVGDLFGVGAAPTTFYIVANVASNTIIELATPYVSTTVAGSAYLTKEQKTVEGTDTVWGGNVYPGDHIKFSTVDTYYEIASITDSDTLLLSENLETDYAAGTTYTIQKRRNNKILVLDTRANIKKKSFGWTIYDGVNPSSFCFYNQTLFYASSIDNYIYTYDSGGALYGAAFTASAKTKRSDCGFDGEKIFKAMLLKAKGTGTVYVTPIVDGVSGTQVSYTFNSLLQTEEVYYPRAASTVTENKFSYIGHEIQFLIETTGLNEDILVYPVKAGWLPMNRR